MEPQSRLAVARQHHIARRGTAVEAMSADDPILARKRRALGECLDRLDEGHAPRLFSRRRKPFVARTGAADIKDVRSIQLVARHFDFTSFSRDLRDRRGGYVSITAST